MLRKYNEFDINYIVDLEQKVLHSSLGYDYYFNDLNNPLAYHYILDEVGFISSIFDGDIAEVLNFGVDPLFQGKGFGKEIITEYINIMILLGAKSIVLEVRSSNVKAISLYKKVGFDTIRIRKKYYSNGEDALFMQKILD